MEHRTTEMPLTRSFKATIKARADRDTEFRRELLTEGVNAIIAGQTEAGKAVLRDYINATIGFQDLAAATDKSSASLQRMFGPNGNPTANNLMQIIAHLQQTEGVKLTVHAEQ